MNYEKSLFSLIPESIREDYNGETVIQAGWAAGPSFIVRKNEDYPEPATLEDACSWLEEYRDTFRACHILFADHCVAWLHRNNFLRLDKDDTHLRGSGCFMQVGSKTVNIRLNMEEKDD